MRKILGTLILCLGFFTIPVHAFQLGEATISSKAGEPLVVKIPIYNLNIDGYSTLAGSIEGFHAAIDSLNYTVKRQGKHYLFVMTSPLAIDEPFEATVVLTYRDQKATRTMLIDPGIEPSSMKRVDIPKTPVKKATKTKRTSKPATNKNTPARMSALTGDSYTVARGDSITTIAQRYRKKLGGSIHQRVIALYRFNVSKFENENINILPVASVLTVPARDEVSAIKANDAKRVFYKLLDGGKADFESMAEAPQTDESAILALLKNETTAVETESARIESTRSSLKKEVKETAASAKQGTQIDEVMRRLDELEERVTQLTKDNKELVARNERLENLLARLTEATKQKLAQTQ